ncbi:MULTISPECIES: 6-carboxytetrahydropterin synthase [Acidobacterium]|uniref:6-carboxytetrahydropterin synthase n=1 Tax=Acidobacterium TaxID=33973 RepID=UPI0005A12A44|nr:MULTISPECIES: 6-carboxytetrahydropterin synthase [Acidobacterium]HCT60137.1 6-pyruvoyl tetrahydrobiopterin synthase [Acidobacterium sp.]
MKAYFGRRYGFSASHRLHTDELSEAENRATYGKCNHPFGHGHNYVVEITVGGPVDPDTGMVCNLVDLDACVREQVLEPFDHTNLNLLSCFEKLVPTTENLCIEIDRRIRQAFREAEIFSVRVEETNNNFFEIEHSAPGTGSTAGRK